MEIYQVWFFSEQDHGKEDKLGSRKAKVEKRKRDKGSTIAWFKDPAGNVLSVVEATM
jgi:predicted enzyme related to lactoylglutathione lyase